MAETSSCAIETRPGLNLAAMRAGEERFLRTWYLVRHLDDLGQSWVWYDDLRDFATKHGIMSKAALRKVLRQGCGAWWQVRGQRGSRRVCLYGTGVKKTFERLDAFDYQKRVYIPVEAFGDMKSFRAYLVGSRFTEKRDGSSWCISLATISELAGRSRVTVSNYMHETCGVRWTLRPGLEGQEGAFRKRIKGQVIWAKRMPNEYLSKLDFTTRGRMFQPQSYASNTRGNRMFYHNEVASFKDAKRYGMEGSARFYHGGYAGRFKVWQGTVVMGEVPTMITC